MSAHSADSGILWQGELALDWRASAQQPRGSREVCAYLRVLHDSEQQADAEAGDALLHAKLDLALAWLARQQGGSLPPPVPAGLGLNAVRWQSATPLPVGERAVLAINLSADLPCELEFAATLRQCEAAATGWQLTAELAFADEAQEEAFSRLVFARHRRRVHQLRGEPS
ncbi:PilZ domain-containing protein [Chitinilyticum litopenaei]|uniref:PilZ domain-containing protein n=1 Tax=Chitinilyticum litopenaei TaxID=1121276 RepID=UPI000415BC64|nr:PilZ domain-containing protein [Chitinilyticum litopenaei]